MWKSEFLSKIQPPRRFRNAYEAGFHAARFGADMENNHFAWFSSAGMIAEWERGQRAGKESFRLCGFGIPS